MKSVFDYIYKFLFAADNMRVYLEEVTKKADRLLFGVKELSGGALILMTLLYMITIGLTFIIGMIISVKLESSILLVVLWILWSIAAYIVFECSSKRMKEL